jgi:hypothetical protein|nr:MAG TPA: hypothetical protein [Caudoviricetes sp.]
MDEFEIVKHIMIYEGIGFDELSEKLGYKSNSSTYKTLDNKHIYVDTWKRYLDRLGYDIVVRKRDSKEEYVVTEDSYPSPLRFHDMELGLDRMLK